MEQVQFAALIGVLWLIYAEVAKANFNKVVGYVAALASFIVGIVVSW
jgi:hypothetical protein